MAVALVPCDLNGKHCCYAPRCLLTPLVSLTRLLVVVVAMCFIPQTVKAAARTVTLSADPTLVSSALAKGTAFDLRSLKPGMLVETIVDSVLSNGILVSI